MVFRLGLGPSKDLTKPIWGPSVWALVQYTRSYVGDYWEMTQDPEPEFKVTLNPTPQPDPEPDTIKPKP